MSITLEYVTKYKKSAAENRPAAVLDDITAEFSDGGIHVILGPSGSGKTTLLRLLNKLESPDKGRILYNDVDIVDISPLMLRRQIGMVFQTPALFDSTIVENIGYGPALKKSKLSQSKILRLLDCVGLAEIEPDRHVFHLSVGQQQRVSFARALANQPEVLLLDEPTASLDPASAQQLLDLIVSIHHDFGIGIIMVTHLLEHAKSVACTISLLIDGRIVEQQPAVDFFNRSHSEITQAFLNSRA